MCGITPERIPAQGIGYWSPLLATVPGAKITVSMRIRGKEIVSSDKGSPAVWLEFTNETGQHRQRTFVVGKDDAGTMHNAELTKGSFDLRDLKQEIVAPKGAIRMALFFGVLPCKGESGFRGHQPQDRQRGRDDDWRDPAAQDSAGADSRDDRGGSL